MKENKVLPVVYGIALFIALINVVALFFSSIQMIIYNMHSSYNGISTGYSKLQMPIGIVLFLASHFCIVGVGAGVYYLFAKKPLHKKICVILSAVALAVLVLSAIVVITVWYCYYFNEATDVKFPFEVYGWGSFSTYSAVLSAVIQLSVCFAVVTAMLFYEYIKEIKDKKKENATQEVVEEITE